MFGRLLPRETSFFDYFDKHAALIVQAADEFVSMVGSSANVKRKAKRIKELEHEADAITHQCIEQLHITFITPIDRYDIHQLISRMDDILDLIEAASECILLYEIKEFTQEVKDMADTLQRSTREIEDAVKGLRDMKEAQKIRQRCVDVSRLEDEADSILRGALGKLFSSGQDALTVIKWKEIYETIEEATDRCEDVANTIEGVVLEHA